MTSRFSNAMVIGDLEKNTVGRMLIVKYVYLREWDRRKWRPCYKQYFQKVLLQRATGAVASRESRLKIKSCVFLHFKDGRKNSRILKY